MRTINKERLPRGALQLWLLPSILHEGSTMVQPVESLTCSSRSPGSILTLGAIYAEYARFHCNHMGFLRMLQFPLVFWRCAVCLVNWSMPLVCRGGVESGVSWREYEDNKIKLCAYELDGDCRLEGLNYSFLSYLSQPMHAILFIKWALGNRCNTYFVLFQEEHLDKSYKKTSNSAKWISKLLQYKMIPESEDSNRSKHASQGLSPSQSQTPLMALLGKLPKKVPELQRTRLW